jgi:hypothetical protein
VRFLESERVRVARVRINRNGQLHEIPDCWIEVSPALGALAIWFSSEEDGAALTVPLLDAQIEWAALDPGR